MKAMTLKLGVFPNESKPIVFDVLKQLIEEAKKNDISIILPEDLSKKFHSKTYNLKKISKNDMDIAVSLGGDGTLLRMTKYVAEAGIPVFGINLGKLGFLTEVEVLDMKKAIENLSMKKYKVENRSMLEVSIIKSGCVISKAIALNDIVLTKGNFSKLLMLDLKIGGQSSAHYPSDGLIISTATGSTAYSLSAGGPIVSPALNVSILTPICPHTLYARPIVIPIDEKIEIESTQSNSEVIVAADGMVLKKLKGGEIISVTKNSFALKFLKLNPKSYYETWQDKLQNE